MKKKQIIRNFILIISILIIVMIVIFSQRDIKDIAAVLSTAKWEWMVVAGMLLVLYMCLMPISLGVITVSEIGSKTVSLFDIFTIGQTEFFFNNITPFSTGGQPLQVYEFKAMGVEMSKSTSILIMNFLIYQIVLNIYGVLAFILFFSRLSATVGNINILIIVGFSVNMLMLIFVILVATTKTTKRVLTWFMLKLSKIKFLNKVLTQRLESFDIYVQNTQIAFKQSIKKWKVLFLSGLIKFIGLGAFYSIPFFCFKTLGVAIDISDFLYIIGVTSFALAMVIWIPTPGSSGGAEFAFTTLFLPIFVTVESAMAGMLIWRFLTYYVVMFVGFVFYLAFEKRRKKYENRDLQ